VIVPTIAPILLDQIGESDCETIGEGWLAQPANAISSMAYVGFGLWLVVRALRNRGEETATQVIFGITVASVGLGSVAFHGPMPPGARLLHDLTIAAVFAMIAARNTGTLQKWAQSTVIALFAALTALVGVVMAVSPEGGIALTAVIAAVAIGLEVHLYRTGKRTFSRRLARWLAAIVTLLVVGAVVNVLGRTGAPLCDPESLYQGHALWHVLTAAAFGLYVYLAFPSPETEEG